MATARKKDKNGYIDIENNPIAKVGVYRYLGSSIGRHDKPNDDFWIYRPAEELAAPDTLQSLNLAPLVIGHDTLGDKGMSAEDKGIHGVVSEPIYLEGDTIKAKLRVYSDTFMDMVDKAGVNELSAGMFGDIVYTVDGTVDFTAGEYNGQKYDGILKDIYFNHVALVENGRMGREVRVLDESDNTGDRMSDLKAAFEAFATAFKQHLGEEMTEPEHVQDDMDEVEEVIEDTYDEDEEKVEDEDCDKDDKKEIQDSIDKAVKTQVTAALAAKDKAAKFYNQHAKKAIGVFDAADLTIEEIAKKVTDKLGLKVPAGQEIGAVMAYTASKQSAVEVQDAAVKDETPKFNPRSFAK
jgi:hypothetical protein